MRNERIEWRLEAKTIKHQMWSQIKKNMWTWFCLQRICKVTATHLSNYRNGYDRMFTFLTIICWIYFSRRGTQLNYTMQNDVIARKNRHYLSIVPVEKGSIVCRNKNQVKYKQRREKKMNPSSLVLLDKNKLIQMNKSYTKWSTNSNKAEKNIEHTECKNTSEKKATTISIEPKKPNTWTSRKKTRMQSIE